ncbi:MAG: ATP-binding SpoIIE family protein phosphatase [Burkholderiales bacterium]
MNGAEQLKVLVADDNATDRVIVSEFLIHAGYLPVTAQNGAEAIAKFQSEAPDIILMDVTLPGMDGYEATSRIRAIDPTRWTPVIFISGLDNDLARVKGLEAGGDDYLTKPVSFDLLFAKIKSMRRLADLQRELLVKQNELTRYHDRAEEETRIAKHLMEQMVDAEALSDKRVKYWIAPASLFSGDLILAERTPAEVLHVMLADATGHGLAAALNVFPVMQTFYAMTRKGFTLSSIVEQINATVKRLMPVDRFVAAAVAAFDPGTGTLEVWNGGLPAPLYVSLSGRIVRRWASRHAPLGILGKDRFDSSTRVLHCREPGQLYLFSDGIPEAENQQGAAFGEERIGQLLSQFPERERFNGLVDALYTHLAGAQAHDDMSLLMLDCRPELLKLTKHESAKPRTAAQTVSYYKFAMSLSANELRHLDVPPMALELVGRLEAVKPHSAELFVIISELYNNALDHGVLLMDSRIKNETNGMERYLELRTARLAALEHGEIELRMEITEHDGEPVLQLCIRDSGEGFDFTSCLETEVAVERRAHGRGIHLVRKLCTRLEYRGCGNEAVAHYAL